MMHDHPMLAGRQPLFKTMYGSRLYGTATPASDVDWKEIYLPPLDQLLLGHKPVNLVHSSGSSHQSNGSEDVDQEWIPLQVFAQDVLQGQTYALELGFAVLGEHRHAGQVLYAGWLPSFTQELMAQFLTSNVKMMSGYALHQAQLYGVKGTRLASVNRLAQQIDSLLATGSLTPQHRLELLLPWVAEQHDPYLRVGSYENHGTQFPALCLLEKIYPGNLTLAETQARLAQLRARYGARSANAAAAQGMDWKASAHAVRILLQAIALLRHGRLEFPFAPPQVEHLLTIRRGALSPQAFAQELENLLAELDAAQQTTTLPAYSEALQARFEGWLKGWLRKGYLTEQPGS